MRVSIISIAILLLPTMAFCQAINTLSPNRNIYTIKQLYLEQVLHNPTENGEDGDNELTGFNRWFNLLEPRCFPDGDMPSPDLLLRAMAENKSQHKAAAKNTGMAGVWRSLGPAQVPSNYNGIGRVNCIVLAPQDTGLIFIGTACGGVWVSHNSGATWASNSDSFPSMSIADIAVNPIHQDTVYAATGDGFGYENGTFNMFWGGLYTAGVMMSTDTGHTWKTTGLSFLQSDTNIIQKLLLHPKKTNILLAATRRGLQRSTDAGATWSVVTTGHIFSMAFKPDQPDTIYAINDHDLMVSRNAGATWSVLYSSVNITGDRCTMAVSPASPNSIWILNDADNIVRSHDGGRTFTATVASPSTTATFYGYYDRVLAVSPTDSNYVLAFGKIMAVSSNNCSSWSQLNPSRDVHVDNHAVAINPKNTDIIYTGNDGGIAVTRYGGSLWKNLGNGLTISQIYRVSTGCTDPAVMLAGVQDNGSFYNDGTKWMQSAAPSGDGMDNAIHPLSEDIMVTSWQNGNFYVSNSHGLSYNPVSFPSGIAGSGTWTTPVALNPRNPDTMYFGFKTIYASYDAGATASALTSSTLFSGGATSLAVAPSDPNVVYACDYSRVIRSDDAGHTWTTITAGLPGRAKTHIAVDYNDPMKVYVSISGYAPANKIYMSTNGGAAWTNLSTGLPNLPVNCVATDSSTPGALFIGTDMGVYYRDSAAPTWTLYNTGLPNVIVDDIDINYTNYMIRAATYGRGIWECRLKKDKPTPVSVNLVTKQSNISIFPNPSSETWKVVFSKDAPVDFMLKIMDATGKTLFTQANRETVDATALPKGNYFIEVSTGAIRQTLKAVKN